MKRLTKKGFEFTNDYIKSNIQSWSIAQTLNKLQQYEDLEEQEKLLKLRATVGDIVYALWKVPTPSKYVIYPAEVKEIRFGTYGNRRTIKYRLEPISYRGRILDFYSDDFEKTVFLTQEEAESALQKINEEEESV